MDGNTLLDELVASVRAQLEAAGTPSICLTTVLVGDDGPIRRYFNPKYAKAADGTSRRPSGNTRRGSRRPCEPSGESDCARDPRATSPPTDGLDPEPMIDLTPSEGGWDHAAPRLAYRDEPAELERA